MMELAKLPALGYTSLLELLAERFHSTPALIQQLNQGVTLAADQEIQVPNVSRCRSSNLHRSEGLGAGGGDAAQPAAPQKPDVTVTVAKRSSALTLTDAAGRVVFYAPVTTGSEHDSLPIGEWKVTGVQFDPVCRYKIRTGPFAYQDHDQGGPEQSRRPCLD